MGAPRPEVSRYDAVCGRCLSWSRHWRAPMTERALKAQRDAVTHHRRSTGHQVVEYEVREG